jgi:hypothetical protein
MKMRSVTHLLVHALLASPLLAGSVTLTPEEDTDVYQFTSYPTSSTYSLGVNVSGGAGHSQRTLLRFPVTRATTDATADSLKSATLRLYILPDATTGSGYGGTLAPGALAVFTQGTPWSATTARWSVLNPADPVATVPITKGSTDAKPVWVEVDATAAVRAWLAGAANNGFILQGESESAAQQLDVLFASMETGFPPELVVSTSEDPPPPPPEVDHVRPEVRITRSVPRNVTRKTLKIRGKATGSDRITNVRYQIGNGPVRKATGTKKWKFRAKLAKGKNRIRIFATDATGDTSRTVKLKVTRKPKKN